MGVVERVCGTHISQKTLKPSQNIKWKRWMTDEILALMEKRRKAKND